MPSTGRGVSADVFRASNDTIGAKRDRHGDVVDTAGAPVQITDKDGLAFIGTLTNVLMGSISAVRTKDREESADGLGEIGFLQNQAPRVKFGDRLVINGQKYEVTSDPRWGTPHSMTGTVFPRYFVSVEARSG